MLAIRRHVYRSCYQEQKRGAKYRGIAFLLTFEEWFQIWIDSGHLHERGRKIGQYCMARFGDEGPYAAGNVKIILQTDNSLEGNLGRKLSIEIKEKVRSAALGRVRSPETREKIRAARIGKKKSAETKKRMSEAAKRRNK